MGSVLFYKIPESNDDLRLPPEDSKLRKEILEKFTTQQDFIHSVAIQLIEAMGEEVVVGIKSYE